MIQNSINIEITSEAQFKADFEKSIIANGKEGQESVEYEILRNLIWGLSTIRGSVHILKILNTSSTVSQKMGLADLGSEAGQCRARLKIEVGEMEEMGDLVDLGEGQWKPGPVRLIEIDKATDACFFTGGFPTSLLPSEMQPDISYRGALRIGNKKILGEFFKSKLWNLETWAGIPEDNIEAWLENISNLEHRVESEEKNIDSIKIYRPENSRISSYQTSRWTDLRQSLTGKYLIEKVRPFGIHEFKIAEFISGEIVAYGNNLRFGDARRAMYAFDTKTKNPVMVNLDCGAEEFIVLLNSEIPGPERRLFTALGRLVNQGANYYPRMWKFTNEYKPKILTVIERLGVNILERRSSSAI